MRARLLTAPGLILLAVVATAASAQTIPLDVEAGYRWADISGNNDLYRSQVNERSGFLIRSFSLAGGDVLAGNKALDRLRLDLTDLGKGPAGALRLEAGLTGFYTLRLNYNRLEAFSALPSFANPLLAQGIVPGQHTFDRVRNVLDVELSLLPDAVVSPILGYSRNRYDGPGQTTYTIGQDEFRLSQDLASTEQEVRVGAAFQAGPVAGQVTQGWRKLRESETLTLAPGAGSGNGSGTVLGKSVSLTDFRRTSTSDANTPVTNAVVTGRFLNRVKVTGTFVRAYGEGDTGEDETATGNLVSFALSRFYTGFNDSISSRAKNQFWRATGRAEVQIVKNFDITAGYAANHRELEGFALVSSLFLNSTTFTGTDPRDVQRLLEANTSIERNEEVFDVGLVARSVGPFALRGTFAQVDQHITATPDALEIVIPGMQGGAFRRRIRRFDGRVTFTASGLTLGADLRTEHANEPIVRIDFIDRDRLRIFGSWSVVKWFRLGASAEEVKATNDRPVTAYDSKVHQYTGELEVTPIPALKLRLSAGKYEADSTIAVIRPVDYVTESSVHSESGKSREGSLTFTLAPFSIEGAYGRYENSGSLPFTIDRARIRCDVAVWKELGVIGEWLKDEYSEKGVPFYGSFDGHRYGLYLRWRQ